MTVKDNKTGIILGIFVILVIITITLIISGNRKDKGNYDDLSEEEFDAAIDAEIEDMEVKELIGLNERERMERYVSSFIKDIDNGELDEAYETLNEDFKTKYFKTLSDFEEYANKYFPSMLSIEHKNIERIGDTYVLWVTLYDSLKGKDSGIDMNFVIKESALNKFELSFSVQE